MEPQSNQTIGHYRLLEKIGEGGMGVVWKALDTRLNREVAIKSLPSAVAADPERGERFNREAKVLASLNHPNIAAIHGLEEMDGRRFLVMELVPGRDLSHRLRAGPIPIEEALEAAHRIAEGLEAAHESGIIHRDLKPANIQITPDGNVKILDFGLAKAFEPEIDSATGSLSPTLTTPATRAGVILGTAAYMSPEQAKGRRVDRRCDIWAFGCVLYEMLTGRRTFKGEGISETLAAVIMSGPDFEALPGAVPHAVRRLLERCLEKDPRRRLRDIGEARFVLEESLAGRGGSEAALSQAGRALPSARGASRRLVGIVALMAAAGGGAAVWLLRPAPPAPPARRLEIAVPGVTRSSAAAKTLEISPDGRHVAWIVSGKLWIRPLDSLEAREIPLADLPTIIFWSPDSRWLGFTSGDRLRKVAVEGGEPIAISDQAAGITGGSGVTWGPDGTIVLSRGDGGLFQVSSKGGDIKPLLDADPAKETDLHQPHYLPDGSGILFVSHTNDGRPDTLELFSGGSRAVLLKIEGQDIWDSVYSATGHILYRRQPSNAGIWALPFSLSSHEVTGDPFLVVPDGTLPSVSTDGTLVYVEGSGSRLVQLVILDREGKKVGKIGGAQEHWPFPTFSPDGGSVAVATREGDEQDIWIYDIRRGTRARLTFGARNPDEVFWSPDGQTVYYDEGASTPPFEMFRKQVDGSGDAEPLGKGWRPAISPDGRHLLFTEESPETTFDIWYVDLAAKGEPVLLVKEEQIQSSARLSPDGRYFVYDSDESGTPEVFLKKFPTGEGKWQVSVDGGTAPRWSRAGDRIYFGRGNEIMEVEVETSPRVQLGAPRVAFVREPLAFGLPNGWEPGFDVSPDGKSVVVAEMAEGASKVSNIIVAESWLAALGDAR